MKTKKAPYGKKFISAAAVNVFTVFTICFFGPMEIFLGNIIEFKFSAPTASAILAFISLAVSLVLSVAEAFLPPKILRPINLFVFSTGLCVYIQSIMLNSSMGSLTGETDVYPKSLIVTNLVIWFAVYAAIFAIWLIMQRLKKSKFVFTGMRFAALALVAMQLVGFLSVYLTMDNEVSALKDQYFTDEGKFELSQNENVVYFIIDTCDGEIVQNMLDEYPDTFEGFNGFTYFPNMSTTHSRTFPSMTYLLSGQKCYFDKPYPQYVNEAFENSDFIDDIDAIGTDIRIYTETQYIGQSVVDKIDNHISYDSSSIDAMNVKGFLKQAIKVSAYRGAPYLLKERFKYTSSTVNKDSMKKIAGKTTLFDDPLFYQQVITGDFKINDKMDKTFRFYHFNGSHPGAVLNEKGEADATATRADNARGCLLIVEEYIKKMKAAGVYENSTIIITADHGYSASSEDLSLPCPTSCIMLVKPSGANDTQPIKTSMAPVCHEDLFATVIKGLGGNSEKYGRTIFEIGEDEDRDRKYYHTALYSDEDGEVALREYSVKGDARLLENYHLTGKYWDVKYSERAVSKHTLSEQLNK